MNEIDALNRRLAEVRERARRGLARRAEDLREIAARLDRDPEARLELRRTAHRARGIVTDPRAADRAAQLEEACREDAAVPLLVAMADSLANALDRLASAPPSDVEPSPVPRETPAPAAKPGAPGEGRISLGRTLILDDDEATRRLVELALRHAGAECLVAADGERALALAEGGLDLAVVDATMPDTDGLTIYRALRARHGPALPIVILSATDAGRLGWDLPDDPRLRWMFKPFRPAALIAALHAFVGEGR